MKPLTGRRTRIEVQTDLNLYSPIIYLISSTTS